MAAYVTVLDYSFETIVTYKDKNDKWHTLKRSFPDYAPARNYVSNDVDYPYANVILEDVDRWAIYNGDELIKKVTIRLVNNNVLA